jgi:hypothetical protein
MDDEERKIIGELLLKRVLGLYAEAVKTSKLELHFLITSYSLKEDVLRILATTNEDRYIAELLGLDNVEFITLMRKISEDIAKIANSL